MSIAITEQQKADLIPLLSGEVESAFELAAELAPMFTVKVLEGTDKFIDRTVGQTHVQRVDWTEVDKASQQGAIGKVEYEVTNSIYIRHAEKNISKLIQDVDVLKELGQEDGKALALQRDVTILAALLQASRQDANTAQGGTVPAKNDLDVAFPAGIRDNFAADGDEADPDVVVKKLKQIITAQRARRKFNNNMGVLIVSYGLYDVLLDNDKLTSTEFSGDNANLAAGKFDALHGVRVMPITTFQDMQDMVGEDNPVDSSLTITALDAEARAVLFEPTAIRVLEVLATVVDAWYEKAHKTNYIDAQAMYNVGVRRQDKVAALYTWEATQTGTVGAGNELASNLGTSITVV